jgi:hypothetical protein
MNVGMRRAKADNPPVNRRISTVLRVFVGSCSSLLERALLPWRQGVGHLPPDAQIGRELPRVVAPKRLEKGNVVAGGSEVGFVEIGVSLVQPLVAGFQLP